jgi:site-specific DNA-methyltransferase (adenine-specific)
MENILMDNTPLADDDPDQMDLVAEMEAEALERLSAEDEEEDEDDEDMDEDALIEEEETIEINGEKVILVKVIPVAEILLGFRYRKDNKNIDGLAESIRDLGLIEPIAVQELPAASGATREHGFRYLLLAGGRRLAAVKQLGMQSISASIYPESLSKLTYRTIELIENTQREKMEWDEEAMLMEEIHNLQIEEHGEKKSTSPSAKGWSIRDTSELMGVSHTTVLRNLDLAKALEKDPSLAQKAHSQYEAKKILLQQKEDELTKELARRAAERIAAAQPIPATSGQANTNDQIIIAGSKVSGEAAKQSMEDMAKKRMLDSYILMPLDPEQSLLQQGFFEGIKGVSDGSIDMFEIDPPYGINLNENKKEASSQEVSTRHYNEIDKKDYWDFLDKVIGECTRVAAPNAWIVLWYGIDPWHSTVYEILRKHGWRGNEIPALWNKGKTGQCNHPDIYMGNSYEPFAYFRRGDAFIYTRGHSNVLTYNAVPPLQKTHPTERPIPMIQDLLSIFCSSGARICVPFLGSGATLMAAANLGITSAFGYDLSSAYKDAYTLKVLAQAYGKYK